MLLAQTASAQAEETIVVTAPASTAVAEAHRFVERLSEPLARDMPLPRFSDPVCVGSTGLPAEAGQAVVDRVSDVAASVGLRVGAPGCTPNVLVIFVENSNEAARRAARANAAAIRSQSLADVKRIVGEPGRARAWIEVETRSRDGDRPSYAPNDPAILKVSDSSRLSSAVRRDVVSATVLIDRDAVVGRDLNQVGDYAAMRSLTGARIRGPADGSSILELFTPGADSHVPHSLTKFDRGYLRGLYAGSGNMRASMKRQSIIRYMVEDGAEGAKPKDR
jgi:hypothetical protein